MKPPSPVASDPIRIQSIMCLLSILNQQKKYAGGNIYLSIYTHIIQLELRIIQSALSVNGNIYFYWNNSEAL